MTTPPWAEHWGIIGGGLLGMTLAHRLARRGQSVTLLEGADHLGGLASAWRLGDVTWDRHYHVILASDTALRGLLAELGLESGIRWTTTRTGFYIDGRLHSMSSIREFLQFPALGLIDKLRLAATILHAARITDGRPLEQVLATEWLAQRSGHHTVARVWLPLLRAKLGDNHERISAAFIWAIIRRMFAARRAGLGRELFGYVPGGYQRILEHFAARLAEEQVDVRLGHAASLVQVTEPAGVTVALNGAPPLNVDRVVITLPAPVAARLCPDLEADERRRLNGIEYQGIICASLLLRRPLAPYYITNITDPAVPFTAVIEMSALVDQEQFGGRGLVYLPKYVRSDDPAFRLPDAVIEREFLGGLQRVHPGFDSGEILAFRISRVRYVLALATLGYSDRLPPMTTSLPGVSIVNSAHIVNGTLNVDETVQLADRAVEWLARQRPARAPVPPGGGHP